MAGGAACLGFGVDQPVVAGLATAGSPLGPSHRVTSAVGGEILALDGRPALDVMADELGDLFRHAGPAVRAATCGWPSARRCGEACEAMRMRRIAAVDRARGAAARRGRPARCRGAPDAAGSGRVAGPGARARPGAARAAVAGRPPIAGIYLASRHRGHGLFGPAVDEIAILREELGQLPLIGLVTDAEIFDGVDARGVGVLVLIG